MANRQMDKEVKKHWETIYQTKSPNDVSWTQEVPEASLDIITSLNLPKQAKIIDVGGGDGKLVDHLLARGYQNITVLDISDKALKKAQNRLGRRAENVKWIVDNVTEFKPNTTYDVWHDRATFHFLTNEEQVTKYIDTVRKAVTGFLTIGTFSKQGPEKCSGLDVRQYTEETLTAKFQNDFDKLNCITEDHVTPFNTTQNFLFCSFKRRLN